MSKDIRSFFSILSTKSTSCSNKTVGLAKKRSKAIESSDEDVIPETPPVHQKQNGKNFRKRKVLVLGSDSEDEKLFEAKKAKEKVNATKQALKPVKAADIFGHEPIKQAKVLARPKSVYVEEKNQTKKKTKRKGGKTLETEKFEDKKFEATLLDLDDDFLTDNMDTLDESIEVAEKEQCKINELSLKISSDKTGMHKTSAENVKQNVDSIKKEKPPQLFINSTPKNAESNINNHGDFNSNKNSSSSRNDKTPSAKRKADSYDPDEDMNRYEKKRHSAILYQKYLNRSGPAHHGTKEMPKGKPDCLKNLCFIRTGVLDSLDNDEFDCLIKNHGGRIVHSVSKKVDYVVVGEDPGPAKIEKAKNYGIKIVSEDEVIELIRTKSGLQASSIKDAYSLDNLIDGLQNEGTTDVQSKKSIKPLTKSNDDSDGSKPKLQPKQSTSNIKSSNSDPQKLNCVGPVVSKYFYKGKNSTSNSSSPSIMSNVKSQQTLPNINKTEECLSWTEKYKPTNTKSIIGQQGDKSNLKRLTTWLDNWFKNHGGKDKPKLIKPSPWAKSDDGSYFKAALLSGPPGIGKTTMAHLVAQESGFDVVEFNASDTRSKRLLQEELSQLLSSKTLAGFIKDGSSPTKKHVLLMDEVDGMAGNEDRGGIQELINLIKNSNIPIICMCNDRNHPKIRSLVNYCFDLRCSKPRLEQIKGAMMSVCFKEGVDIMPNMLNEIILAAGMDIRQILTNLSIWSAGKNVLNVETTTKDANSATKDVPLGQWEVCHKVFTEAEHNKMSITDRARLFYHDYSLAPLFVQENYLKAIPHAPKNELLKRFAAASESISLGDIIDKQIRSTNNWSLLDAQAMCASVIPGGCLRGHLSGQIDFPSWLGKNSKKNKFIRLVSEIQAHMRTSMSGSRSAVNLDYVTHLRNSIANPLINNGLTGIPVAVEVMRSYNLLREDLDGIIELSQWPKHKDPMNMVESKVKAAFTRAYNKVSVLPYSVQSATFKKKVGSIKQNDDFAYEDQEENTDSNPEDNDDIANDAMIKAKKPSGRSKKVVESIPSSSKKPAGGGGKGRKKK